MFLPQSANSCTVDSVCAVTWLNSLLFGSENYLSIMIICHTYDSKINEISLLLLAKYFENLDMLVHLFLCSVYSVLLFINIQMQCSTWRLFL